MGNKYSNAMSRLSDSELLKILNEDRSDYELDAIKSAEVEISKRNLSELQIKNANIENDSRRLKKAEKSKEGLNGGIKVLAFIFPGIILFIFAGLYRADGYDRKANELKKATLYGFGFYIGIFLLLKL